ncbi:MAG: helicase C-terminal domain-containing protein [Methanobacteriaceae archaeon]
MSNSMFCPDCGMLQDRCICTNETKKINKSSYGSKKSKSTESNKYSSYNTPSKYSINSNANLNTNFNSNGNNNTNDNNGYDSIWSNIIPKKISKLNESQIREMKSQYPNIEEEIIENFPFTKPRRGQLEIISDIYQAIESGFKYIVLEAGTGTGKSAAATTLSRIYKPAYILTMTKQLQEQYHNEFTFPLVKGRNNFRCLHDDFDSSCDVGTCKTIPSSKNFFCPYGVSKSPGPGAISAFDDSLGNPIFYHSEDKCSYWEQKSNAVNSPITLMNYDYAILELNYIKHFGPRNLLVLDEAHNIENKLMMSLELNLFNKSLKKDIKKVISPESLKSTSPDNWISEIDAIRDYYKELSFSNMAQHKVDRINRTTGRLSQLRDHLKNEPLNWVIDPNKDGVSFKPLRVHHYAQDFLFQHGEVNLFMSATILSHNMFSQWLGLDPQEVYHVKVDSPFPPDKRPIELNLAGKMGANRIKRTAPKTLPILRQILERHKYDKGLIHTNSYRCQQYIMNNLNNSRFTSHSSNDRATVLNHFEKSKNPLVLVSPSMSEGVDLPYDKCRFQVIYKVPFPYLGDKQVNMRRKRDQKWYAYKTVMTLLQAYGRGMRAEDDFCYTYILDEDINMLFRSPIYRSLVPEFFKEAIIDKS